MWKTKKQVEMKEHIVYQKALDQESETMKGELNWLLQHEFPLICKEVKKNLEDCMKFIKKSKRGAIPDPRNSCDEEDPVMLLEDSRIVSFSNASKTLYGMVVLEGWNIEESEFEVKFTKYKKPVSFKSGIKPSNPWRLKQIQSVYEYCKLACQSINESLQSLNDQPILPNRALQVIRSSMEILASAHSTLLLPSRSQAAPGAGQFTFQPSLPMNILVDFKIKQKMVVITAAHIRAVPRPTNDKSKKVFYSLRQNQHFEILEQLSVECETKKLDTIFSFIQESSMLCEEFKEKLLSLM